MKVTIGALIIPQNGDMAPMRNAWVEADAMGVERIYTLIIFLCPPATIWRRPIGRRAI